MNKKIEILAPAGSYEGMIAAMNAGCDAVYIGGSSFGARANANNLEEEALLRAIDETHIREKNLYLTVNTLIKENERIEELYRFLEKFYLQGLDAVIVQDVGVMHFIHRHFPMLPIHASTQTTITMAQGAELLRDCGVTRIVTPRELSLAEVKNIRDNTELEIETFVHGALCYSFSGQCLMSSMIGGRSGNRGRCAQPCRMPYQLMEGEKNQIIKEGKYLLSPKDIFTVPLIPEMIEAGIDSFKVEGRMKRPEYAAAVSYVYRKYVDLYFSVGKEKFKSYCEDQNSDYLQDRMNLQDVYNRGGFSQGYFANYHGKSMMSMGRPNHSGVFVGEVKEIEGSQVSILLKEKVNAQDILEIRDGEESEYEFTVKDSHEKGELLRTNIGRRPRKEDQYGKSKWVAEPSVHIRNQVYRTKNNKLLEQIASDYMEKNQKQKITGVLRSKLGKKLELTVTYQDCTVIAYQDEVQAALKQPMTKAKIYQQIDKTGDTIFIFEGLEIEADDNIFVPVAWLNEIRRDALQLLYQAVTGKFRRAFERKDKESTIKIEDATSSLGPTGNRTFGVKVSVHTRDQFELALLYKEITSIYVDLEAFELSELEQNVRKAKECGKDVSLVLPHICRKAVYEKLKKNNLPVLADNISGYIIKNFEEYTLLKEIFQEKLQEKEIVLNYNMYVFNREAKEFWKEKGVTHFTAPVELNYQELRTLGISDCDILVYGYVPLMVSVQCVFDNSTGCRRDGDNREGTYLYDRYQKKFLVQANCNYCYNTIYNGQCLSLLKQVSEVRGLHPRNIRLDFTIETKEEMKLALKALIDVYVYEKNTEIEILNYTTGHFKRGVE